jgi:hypothetical protein
MWMLQQALEVPDGLKTGPINVTGAKLPGSGDSGPALNLYPAASGPQHCEVAGMRDTLDDLATSYPSGNGFSASSHLTIGKSKCGLSFTMRPSMRLSRCGSRLRPSPNVRRSAPTAPKRCEATTSSRNFMEKAGPSSRLYFQPRRVDPVRSAPIRGADFGIAKNCELH